MDRYFPLYEAKMLHHFDHRWATYRDGKFRAVTQSQKQDPNFVVLPRYWVSENSITSHNDHYRLWCSGWRDFARSTDIRTWIVSPHPMSGVADTLLQVIFSEPSAQAAAGFHSASSSFVSDYLVRQKIGSTHLKYYTVKQFPILPPTGCALELIECRVRELALTAWDMAPFAETLGYTGPPFRWDEERRSLIRAELDALMFHLYGVNRDDVDYIMETFPIVKRQDEATQHQEYRTKRLILERYDSMVAAFEAAHGSLDNTPNGSNPPLDRSTLGEYSLLLADALDANYKTVLDPPPADPSQAHPESTRPAWA